MTDPQAADFVAAFAAARQAGDAVALAALWRPDGILKFPFVDRPVRGDEIADFLRLTLQAAPQLTWDVLSWSARGDVVMIEYRCTNGPASWDGVNKFVLRDGRIAEEIVYCDTAPLRAAREGRTLEPMIPLD